MKTYKIIFTTKSHITTLPNSQTIFGAICNVLKLTQGENRLKEYLDSFETNPLFVHSSMLVDGIFPMPKANLFSIGQVNEMIKKQKTSLRLEMLNNLKQVKKIKYISEKVLLKYVIDKNTTDLRDDILSNKLKINDSVLRCVDEMHVVQTPVLDRIVRSRLDNFNLSGDTKLFNENTVLYPKGTEFVIYVKSNIEASEIKRIFRYFKFFACGNKGSIGRNLFELKAVEEYNICTKNNGKLILSQYIPKENEVNLANSYYQIDNMYSKSSNEHAANISTGYYSFFSEGSYLSFIENKEYYGKNIINNIDGKLIHHYGIGFTL